MLTDGVYDVPAGHVAMIVTHLEMTARQAPLPKSAFPRGVDLVRQAQVDTDTYLDVFRRVGGMPWLWWSRLILPEPALRDLLNDPGITLYYVMRNGRPDGMLELDFRDPAHCEIAFFGLTPELVGSGAGRALMHVAITEGLAKAPKLYLHTCTLDSPQALGFYRHMGFTPFRQEVEIARDPRLTGHLPAEAGPNTPIFSG